MSESDAPGFRTHRSYVWSGLGLGLFAGIFGLLEPEFAQLGLLTLAGAGSAGAVMGSVFFRTRAWSRHSYRLQVLRVALALVVAGIVLSDLAVIAGLQTSREARDVLAFLPGVALGVGWAFKLRYRGDGDPVATMRDIGILCAAAAGTVIWAVLVLRAPWVGAA